MKPVRMGSTVLRVSACQSIATLLVEQNAVFDVSEPFGVVADGAPIGEVADNVVASNGASAV